MSDDYGTATYGTGTYGTAVDATFATIDDLAHRLGLTSAADFTAAQSAQGLMFLVLASGLIIQAADKDAAWANALTTIPVLLRAVCLEVCARVMSNPTGARSESETLGAYQHASSYADGSHGMWLTDREVLLVRRVVFGTLSATTIPHTLTFDPDPEVVSDV